MSIPQILNLYLRILALVLGLTAGLFILFAGTHAAFAASLRNVSVITGNVLTVGDIFDGISAERASHVLGPAPQPGQDMILNARTLMRIAAALDLSWRPDSTTDQIVIRRSATIVSEAAIRNSLGEELEEEGVDTRFDIAFAGGLPEVILPGNYPATVEVSNLRFDPQRDWFEATLSAPSREKALIEVAVAGKVRRLVKVPVLKDTLRQGDIIGIRDIAWTDLYNDEIQPNLILQEEKLIGMTPRRILAAGKPVRDSELEQPQLVERGDMITLIHKEGPLVLTTKGKALQGGAKGDFIRIVNITSNRTLEGFVTAEREVTVR